MTTPDGEDVSRLLVRIGRLASDKAGDIACALAAEEHDGARQTVREGAR
ncbi:MAG TPA: hypothetical protein VEK11_00410 [Thermoanaerobaculia bacterium]|nr:hypothetical protein [Thermoanaerobaculia bacterium]